MALLLTIPLQANVYIGELPVATKSIPEEHDCFRTCFT